MNDLAFEYVLKFVRQRFVGRDNMHVCRMLYDFPLRHRQFARFPVHPARALRDGKVMQENFIRHIAPPQRKIERRQFRFPSGGIAASRKYAGRNIEFSQRGEFVSVQLNSGFFGQVGLRWFVRGYRARTIGHRLFRIEQIESCQKAEYEYTTFQSETPST